MQLPPIVRSLLTAVGVILFIGPVLYASDHALTARLAIVFIACWLLAAVCLLAGYTGKRDDTTTESSGPDTC